MSSRNTPGTAPRSGPGKKPSKAQMQKQQAAKRAMAAASGARAARNKRLMMALVPVAVVIVVVGILVGVHAATSGNKSGHTTSNATAAVVQAVTSVPADVLDQVGVGTGSGPRQQLTGDPLTADGKPKVLYVGAEWCPYCAAERWALAEALSRFGTLTDLGETKSGGSPEAYPDTATLSFHGSKFSSKYIALKAAEIEDGDHKSLDKLSKSENKLFVSPSLGNRGFPFIDIGGKYQFGVQYDPSVLSGKTHAQIADAMSDPTSDIGKAVDGSANILTAAICETTDQQPSDVCTAKGVAAAKSKLTSAGS